MNLYSFHSKPKTLEHYELANTTVPYAFVKKRSQHDSEFVFPKSLSEKQILAISKVPELAVHYAIYVIGGRWPEAEPYIIKAPGMPLGMLKMS